MLSQIDIDGTVRALSQLTQLDADGTTVRALQELWQNDADGTPRLIFSASGGGGTGGASVSPDYVQGTRSSRGSSSVTTAAVTVTLARPSPTSLVWTFADAGWSVASPGALTTSFRSPSLGPDESASTSVFVTATYSGSPSAVSNTVTLYANNSYIDAGLS